ncbi:unnamed protein product [Lasius platythorax]|uniref:Uncharacterized protein n=1 Tax=Lasius platythorax TaxID=488582 RepID=A0AAV2MWC5_9HYME
MKPSTSRVRKPDRRKNCVIYYNSTTHTHSGNPFEVDGDKENVSCESKNKKQKAGLLQNPLSKVVNCNDPSTTTAGSCDNRSTKPFFREDRRKCVMRTPRPVPLKPPPCATPLVLKSGTQGPAGA